MQDLDLREQTVDFVVKARDLAAKAIAQMAKMIGRRAKRARTMGVEIGQHLRNANRAMRRLLVPLILPAACAWITRHEQRILAAGLPLTAAQRDDAFALGLREPERVRLLALPQVPLPLAWLARFARPLVGTSFAQTSGLTAQFGIYLRSELAGDRHLLAHELTHTRQYERLGGVRPFLRQYLRECLTVGYYAAPLEEEARLAAADLCGF